MADEKKTNELQNAADNAADEVKETVDNAKDAAEEKVQDAADKVEETVEDAKDKAEKKFSDKSSAERAREKRKASIEESARRQAEKEKKRAEKKANETKGQKRAKVIAPIAIILVAILVFLGWFFGVPNRMFTALTVSDGTKVSVAEYEYYYRSLYNYYSNMSQQYESYYSSYYGEGAGQMVTGFDYTKTPENQAFTAPSGSDLTVDKSYGDNPTWADYFEQTATETVQQYDLVYNKAIEEGYEMSDSEKDDMDDFIEELRQTAADSNYSLDAYLRAYYGRGMTESLLKEIYEKQTIAADYLEDQEKALDEQVTDEEITAEYKENTQDYTTVSLRYFSFTPEITADDDTTDDEIKKANKELKAKAKEMLAEATEDNFSDLAVKYAADDYKDYYEEDDTYTTMADYSYETLSSSVSEKAADWAYADDTKVGDKKLFAITADSGLKSYYVLLLTEEPSRDETLPVTVRQILFQVTEDEDTDEDTDSDSEEDTDSEKDADSDEDADAEEEDADAEESTDTDSEEEETTHTDAEAKKLAEDTLQEWKDGKATDASFAKLAKKYSEDTGSASEGGLYEDITPTSGYVQEFLDWCFEDGRKVGDTGIIKTDYGYHIMYCKSIADEPVWKSTIREALGTKAYEAYEENLTKNDKLDALNSFWAKRVRSRVEKYAEQTIASMNSSASSDSDYISIE